MNNNKAKTSPGGVPSRSSSRKVTPEDERRAIEQMRRETPFRFHLTDGHISHIRKVEAATKTRTARQERRRRRQRQGDL